ncbi:glutamine--fructose-6-phosphate transaminase (isomerizing) [Chlorobium phaeobacteroides]|uniref:Glutamine--fructose-6-phosphate aminotransferase [isomerizing] n=1 Tax=Chlorobium phaeobacteroides (strain DSM 266 / SMG 266 / 2430) TaxID=290317 RepID=A1BJL6_CHLPD|nr:glutamine--fructose-6-phosphate transaminase (isomerizing) [Chlorobium phaeobacteroides]ABL66593.1 glutamine--fructose-6-phosphate transaminase [Chlorobium phaeobacteroides DSM 266]
MCGIVGYIGKRDAAPLLLHGLKRLEYRGYDSAGIAVIGEERVKEKEEERAERDVSGEEGIRVVKRKGNVAALAEAIAGCDGGFLGATVGIGHTRWATHGDPSDRNAHPHLNEAGDIALIHNGIIENHAALRVELEKYGYSFVSDTDSEVLVHLIDHLWANIPFLDFESAVRQALSIVEGAYGICVISMREPDRLIVARKGSPLVIGVGEGEYFVASDAAPLVEYTRHVVYLADGDMAVVRRDGFKVKSIGNIERESMVTELDFEIEEIEKGGFEHFMLKEIFEQPSVMRDVMRGRVSVEHNALHLGGIQDHLDTLRGAKRMVILACGTSWHAGLIGKYLIEEFARICVEVDYASEFRYRNPIVGPGDVVIVISQSGETADTLAALRIAKERGATVMGICNVVGSTIARETHFGMYTHAGPEIGVASTKAFTAQVVALFMIAVQLRMGNPEMSGVETSVLLQELLAVPDKAEQILRLNDDILSIAESYWDAEHVLYLGRGYNFPVALEGALKLKEISYIHAEGYPAAEMKHGPIALIDEDVPVVFIAIRDHSYRKVLSNIEEVRSRKGRVIAIATEGDREIGRIAEHVIYIPEAAAALMPLLTVIPLQLLAYHIATLRGCNVDRPRNLAKSVTVE